MKLSYEYVYIRMFIVIPKYVNIRLNRISTDNGFKNYYLTMKPGLEAANGFRSF